jgi:hypothetical protein
METYFGLHVKCPLWLRLFTETGMYHKSLSKIHNMELNKNPFSSSQVAACYMRERWADMVKLISAYLQLFIVNVPRRIIMSLTIMSVHGICNQRL